MRRDPGEISFLPVEPKHYPLLRKWLGEPHMQEWWGEPDEELGFIRDMVEGRDTTRPFLIALDGTPVGYVQYWFIGHHQNAEWIADHPWLAELPSDTVGVDLSIGDAGQLSQGIGSARVEGFRRGAAPAGSRQHHHRPRPDEHTRRAGLYEGWLPADPAPARPHWRRIDHAARAESTRDDMTDFSPREIVSELDRFIIGQGDAKRAVAIALRNRWRRMQLDERLREEVLPKNILMIGPTGVGKTEISRRLARLAGAPFLKVEATKFTEVGYVGRDVEQIVRDLVEIAINQTRERRRKDVEAKAHLAAEDRVVDALTGPAASPPRRTRSAASCAAARWTTRKSRSRCSNRAAGCRCSRFPACRARRWARSRSATSSARSAAAAPRRAASP